MTRPAPDIPRILMECERNGTAPPYRSSLEPKRPDSIFDSQGPTIAVASEGAEVFVISDLHLASGRGIDGRYDGCENFFFDASFRRFLEYANARPGKSLLIINGDFVDFLRVTYVPGLHQKLSRWERSLKHIHVHRRARRINALSDSDRDDFLDDYRDWSRILARIGIEKSPEQLVNSVTDKEELYGLKTHDYKSVLRLHVVINGHPEFFDALACWLGWGHKIVIVKGNHDLEWYWLAVRNYLRLELAERLAAAQAPGDGEGVRHALTETVLPAMLFVDHAMVIDGDFYVEHGHPYDPLTRVIGEDTVNEGQELNIPFGSFFNRYLLNFLETDYPFLDNIRPTQNILPLMLKNNFVAGIRLLIDHLIVIFRVAPRQYVRYIFGQHLIWRVLLILLVLLVPPFVLISYQLAHSDPFAVKALEWIGWLLVGYLAIRLLATAQLSEPDSLARFARHRFQQNRDYRLMTFGHTHNPDQFRDNHRWFYNTGTWIPIVETSSTTLRTDRTFIFLHLGRDAASGQLAPGLLRRWDDEANRTEPLVLFRGLES